MDLPLFSKEEAKQIFFEIYSAGYEASYNGYSLTTSYNAYWDYLIKLMEEY